MEKREKIEERINQLLRDIAWIEKLVLKGQVGNEKIAAMHLRHKEWAIAKHRRKLQDAA